MDSREFNRAILSEILKIADEVFGQTTIKSGTYTAAELAKQKDSRGNAINFKIDKSAENKVRTVEVDNFKCSFLAYQVFNLVWKFEQLAGIKSGEKKRFVKMSEVERNAVCSFYATVEKSHTTLSKLVSDDELRPVLTQILMDAENGYLVASDGHAMKQMPIRIESESELPKGMNLYINPKDIKSMIGKNRVDVYDNGGFNETVIINLETGMFFKNATEGRYPNYKSVYPKLRRDGFVRFAQKEIRPLIKFCKHASRYAYKATMTITIEKGSQKVLFAYCNMQDGAIKERYFCLNDPASMTVRMGLSGEFLANMSKDWIGGMWVVAPDRAVIMDYNNDATGLIMPIMIDNAIYPDPGDYSINALDRYKPAIEAAQPEHIEAAQPEHIEAAQPDPIEAAQSDPIEAAQPEHIEAAQPEHIEAAQPEHIEAAQPEPIEAAQTASCAYDVTEKSPAEAVEWPLQLRILLAIIHGFGLAETPLRYVVAEKLAEYIEAMLPAAVPTDLLLRAIKPAFRLDAGCSHSILSNPAKTGKHARLSPCGETLSRVHICDTSISCGYSAGSTGCVGVETSTGCGGYAAAFGCGGAAVSMGCGGAAVSTRRGEATAGSRACVSLPRPYALWDLSPITRQTGLSPPPDGILSFEF